VILTVDHLGFSYGKRDVLKDVSFSLKEGDFLSVLGPNGVGKSTLFRCILGLLSGYSGRIALDGRDLRAFSRREISKRIAYIPQACQPTFGYSVLDTVLMGTTGQLSPFSQPKKKQVDAAMAALERAGADHLAGRDFSRLSGGEQQLVLVARALAQQAEILIMDEPTSALDYGNQLHVYRVVRALAKEGYAVLLSTHNPQHALSYSSRVLALSRGGVAAFGRVEDVMTRDMVSDLYGVDVSFVQAGRDRVIVPVDQ